MPELASGFFPLDEPVEEGPTPFCSSMLSFSGENVALRLEVLGVFDDAGLSGFLSHDLNLSLRCLGPVLVVIDLPPDLGGFASPLADGSAIFI